MIYKNIEDKKKYANDHYKKNSKLYKERARKHTKFARDRNRTWVLNYLLSHPCVDCGETDPLVLTFDHVRGKKKDNISALSNSRPCSIKTIDEEIKKCDVRCFNCHMRKTNKDRSKNKGKVIQLVRVANS